MVPQPELRVMIRRSLLALVLAVMLVSPAVAAPPKPAIEVRLKAVTELAPIVKYVSELMGQGDAGAQYAGVIDAMAKEENGFDGVDLSKPVGAYVGLADAVEDSPVVLMIPVKNQKAALDALSGKLGLDPKKGDGDVYSMDVPNIPGTVYLRFANDYAYLTIRSVKSIDKDKLLAPKDFFTDKTPPVLGVTVNIQEWPTDLKKTLIGQAEMQWNEYLRGLDATPTQKLLNSFMVDVGIDALKTVLADGETLSVKLNAVPKSDDISLTVNMTAKPNTTLAKTLDGFGNRETLGANLLTGSAYLGLQFRTPAETTKKLGKLAEDIKTQLTEKAGDTEKAVATVFSDALMPWLKSGDIQIAFGLVTNNSAKPQLKAALKIDEGDNIRRLLMLAGAGLPKEQAKFEAAVAKLGDRKLHKMTLPQAGSVPVDIETLWIVTSDDLTLVSSGASDKTIREWAVANPKATPMLNVKVAIADLLPMLAPQMSAEDRAKMLKENFGDTVKDADTLIITGQGGKDFQLNAVVKGKVIALYAASQAVQK